MFTYVIIINQRSALYISKVRVTVKVFMFLIIYQSTLLRLERVLFQAKAVLQQIDANFKINHKQNRIWKLKITLTLQLQFRFAHSER